MNVFKSYQFCALHLVSSSTQPRFNRLGPMLTMNDAYLKLSMQMNDITPVKPVAKSLGADGINFFSISKNVLGDPKVHLSGPAEFVC